MKSTRPRVQITDTTTTSAEEDNTLGGSGIPSQTSVIRNAANLEGMALNFYLLLLTDLYI